MSGTTWHLNPLLSIDTETTGVDVLTDRIVELAAVDIAHDGTTSNGEATLIDPGVDIPTEAAAIHGITNSKVIADGVQPEVALAALAERINTHIDTYGVTNAPICIYNATFDWPLLLVEAERHGVDIPPFCGVLDPLLFDRKLDKYRKGSRKLLDVAAHYSVDLSAADAHGGLADATASGLVMRKILAKWPTLTDFSLATLWLKQVRHQEEWRFGFVDHMRRTKDPDFEIAPGWPIPARAS